MEEKREKKKRKERKEKNKGMFFFYGIKCLLDV